MLINIMAILFINLIIGACVLESLDKHGELFQWYSNAPFPILEPIVLTIWPIILAMYWIRNPQRKNHRKDNDLK